MNPINKDLLLQLVQWITNSGHTPYVEVLNIEGVTGIPAEYFAGGTVRMNISAQATNYFSAADNGLSFGTRFNRVHSDVFLPYESITGVVSFEEQQAELGVRQGWIVQPPAKASTNDNKPPKNPNRSGLRLV